MTVDLTILPTPRVPLRWLGEEDRAELAHLLGRIGRKYRRNKLLSDYYDGRVVARSLGIAVSPEFDQLETVVGWPGTSLDVLHERRSLDHFEVTGSADLQDELDAVLDENDWVSEFPQTLLNEMLHGIAFIAVGRSLDNSRVVVLPTSATRMTCEYNRGDRRITAAASSDEPVRQGDPRQATFMKPDRTIVVELVGGRYKVTNEYPNPSGIVPVERFVNRQRLDEPWGKSEITPTVLSATDRAVRTLQAMEVAREFFSMPALFALNVAQDAFVDKDGNQVSAWESYWGKLKALSGPVDEDGEPGKLQPDIKQIPGAAPTPLIDMIKMDSMIVAAETGIPPGSLGFVTDNPASGEAMAFYENRLVKRARMRNKVDQGPTSRVARLVLMAQGHAPDSIPSIKPVFDKPETFAPSSTTDAVTKQVAARIIPADSDVALEQLGYDRTSVERIQADRRKAKAASLITGLAQLTQLNTGAQDADPTSAPAVLAS